MAPLQSAHDAYAAQQRIAVLGVRSARRVADDARRLVALMVGMQAAAATEGGAGVDAMLSEQGIGTETVGTVNPRAIAGTASDGRSLSTLLEQFTASTVSPQAFDRMIATQIQDAGRTGAATAIAVRPQVTRYVRMLVAPSCSRCALLAGKVFRSGVAFDRHPQCDCRHIPTVESLAGDLTTNPQSYFDSLSPAEQDRIFTKAGAEAVRKGADMGQVVNARRGMYTAQFNGRGWIPKGPLTSVDMYGRKIFTTNESTTRRGSAYRLMGARHGANKDVKVAGQRYARTTTARLMPESIIEHATSPADAIRLLKVYGYIL